MINVLTQKRLTSQLDNLLLYKRSLLSFVQNYQQFLGSTSEIFLNFWSIHIFYIFNHTIVCNPYRKDSISSTWARITNQCYKHVSWNSGVLQCYKHVSWNSGVLNRWNTMCRCHAFNYLKYFSGIFNWHIVVLHPWNS